MKKFLMYGGVGLVVVVVGFAGVVAMQPAHAHIERSTTIAAPVADVFPFANDYKLFMAWNPWNQLDPDQKVTFSDNPAGVGAWYAWEGDENVGRGKMTITDVVPDQKVVSDLAFYEPFEANAVVTMTMAADGPGTKVTWGYDTENNFMAKAAGLFMDMDAMLGADFERGLGMLKPAAEKASAERMAREEAAAAAAAEAAAAEGAVAADAGGEAGQAPPQ